MQRLPLRQALGLETVRRVCACKRTYGHEAAVQYSGTGTGAVLGTKRWYGAVCYRTAVHHAQGGGYSVKGGCIQIYRAFERYLGSGELLAGGAARLGTCRRRCPQGGTCCLLTSSQLCSPCPFMICAAVKLDVPFIKMQRNYDSVLVRWACVALTRAGHSAA